MDATNVMVATIAMMNVVNAMMNNYAGLAILLYATFCSGFLFSSLVSNRKLDVVEATAVAIASPVFALWCLAMFVYFQIRWLYVKATR